MVRGEHRAAGGRARVVHVVVAFVFVLEATVAAMAPAGAGEAAPGALGWHTAGATILDPDGRPTVLHGISWFGLETPNFAPHGLWSRNLDELMGELAGAGFDTLRLPWSSQLLDPGTRPTGIDLRLNPDLEGLDGLGVLDRTIAAAARHGLHVVLDRHRPDAGSQSPLWYTPRYDEARWIADWTTLARRYGDDPTVIAADLHNEPHGDACWGCGDPRRDWAAAAERAGDAILDVAPRWLIVVEGVERAEDGSTTWWGGGLRDVRTRPIHLRVPGKVVYSPHDYPASVYPQVWFRDPTYPANLPRVWHDNWGYLAEEGIAPVWLGEFGTMLRTASDQAWLGALVTYLHDHGISWAFWSWNPNSGDTGGILRDDWRTLDDAKLAALAPLLGGAPADATVQVAAPVATPSAPPPTVLPPATVLPPVVVTAPGGAAALVRLVEVATWRAAIRRALDATGVVTQLRTTSTWDTGRVVEVDVRNARAVPLDGWTVQVPVPAGLALADVWNADCTQTATVATCSATSYNGALAPGASTTFGARLAA
jgi:endoglucanase